MLFKKEGRKAVLYLPMIIYSIKIEKKMIGIVFTSSAALPSPLFKN
jgi:hypothetical protein